MRHVIGWKEISVWIVAMLFIAPYALGMEMTLSGRIEIFSINPDDTITAVCIETRNDYYRIKPTPMGRKLHKLIGSHVKIIGDIEMDGSGRKIINVKSYEITDAGPKS